MTAIIQRSFSYKMKAAVKGVLLYTSNGYNVCELEAG